MEQAIFWLVGAVGVPVLQYLKKLLGVEGKSAMWLTIIVAAALGFVGLFIDGGMDGISPENFFSVFGQILAAATIAYKLLMK